MAALQGNWAICPSTSLQQQYSASSKFECEGSLSTFYKGVGAKRRGKLGVWVASVSPVRGSWPVPVAHQ